MNELSFFLLFLSQTPTRIFTLVFYLKKLLSSLTMSFLIIVCAFKKGNNTNTTRYKCTHAVFASQPDARDGLHGGTGHSRKIYLLTRVI